MYLKVVRWVHEAWNIFEKGLMFLIKLYIKDLNAILCIYKNIIILKNSKHLWTKASKKLYENNHFVSFTKSLYFVFNIAYLFSLEKSLYLILISWSRCVNRVYDRSHFNGLFLMIRNFLNLNNHKHLWIRTSTTWWCMCLLSWITSSTTSLNKYLKRIK